MSRTSLVVAAVALLLANSATIPAQTLPADDPAWSRAVNLMPLIDPEKDALSGEWRIENGALVSGEKGSKELPSALLQIPYQPPTEYDFRIAFARRTGLRNVVQILAKRGRSFAWDMGGALNTLFGFTQVNGKHVPSTDNPTTVKGGLSNNQRYVSLVSVRSNGLKAYLDGKLMSQWRTRYDDMSPFSHFRLRDQSLLGLASYHSSAIFYKIELLEITGKGKPMRKAPVANLVLPVQKAGAPPEVPATISPPAPQFSPLQLIEVKPISQKKNLTSGVANVATFQQCRALNIAVRNGTQQPVSGIIVRWGVVIADIGTGKTTAYGNDEMLDLKPTETKHIETISVTAVGRQGGNQAITGEKIMGHGVQLLVGDRVVAEEFTPPSVKPAFDNLKPAEAKR